jgi:ATP adenylyltransferase
MTLLDFIKSKMKMSHIYQPVMIKSLLANNGKMDIEELAKELLKYDLSQVEYYRGITNNMVGTVLRKHNIVEKEKNAYKLVEFNSLTESEKASAIKECNQKIDDYIKKRGLSIWEHRRRNRRPVPGSIRFQVLKRANFRCELCGISADIRALEVDHITPKNSGGKDSIHNYQALCFTCNAQKKDTDKTDFRNWTKLFDESDKDCPFCSTQTREILFENNLAKAFYDLYPVTANHILIIPKRHISDYFELHQAELNAIGELIKLSKFELEKIDQTIKGFNIGVNSGKVSGQTINHCHVHLIPRRDGDIENPIGGIRNMFPGKGNYLTNGL